MAHIHGVEIGSNNYLIEPTLYSIASTNNNGSTYEALLNNFELTNASGVAIQINFPHTNAADAKLNINGTGEKFIYYNGSKIIAETLKENHVYTLVYDNRPSNNIDVWQIVGDPLDTRGTWTGNARSLETAREIYVDLTTTRPDNPVSYNKVLFDGTSDIALHVNGILPLIHGGTGANSINKYGIIYGNSTRDAYTSTATCDIEGMVVVGHGQNNAPDWYRGLLLTSSGTPATYSAAFSGSVTINSTLGVTGNTTLSGDLTVGGATTLQDALTVTGATSLGSTLAITGNTTIGTSSITSTLDVYGVTTLHNNANINGNTTIGTDSIASTLNVYGATTLNSTLLVLSTSTLTEKVGIGGAPDSATTSDQHILKIHGSTLITTTIGSNEFNCAHIDVTNSTRNSNNICSVNFYPESNAYGDIGNTSHRWYAGYFSHLLNISDGTSSININTNNGTSSIGIVTITASVPTIILDTVTADKSTWEIVNSNLGIFSLNNQASSNKVELKGTDHGFELTTRLYINPSATLDSSSGLDLYVNNTSELLGKVGIGTAPDPTTSGDQHILVINGSTLIKDNSADAAHIDSANINSTAIVKFYPHTTNSGTLGIAANGTETNARRWANVYIGTADTYGDEYTSIYWANGVPTQVMPVQYKTFTIMGNTSLTQSIDLTSLAFNDNSYVLEIVVNAGTEQFLEAPIQWASDSTENKITLTTKVTNGQTVTGYIIVARGGNAPALAVQSNT